MRIRVDAVAFLEVPDTSLGGAATREAVVDLAKRTVEKRLPLMWQGWSSSVEVSAAEVPAVATGQEVGK